MLKRAVRCIHRQEISRASGDKNNSQSDHCRSTCKKSSVWSFHALKSGRCMLEENDFPTVMIAEPGTGS